MSNLVAADRKSLLSILPILILLQDYHEVRIKELKLNLQNNKSNSRTNAQIISKKFSQYSIEPQNLNVLLTNVANMPPFFINHRSKSMSLDLPQVKSFKLFFIEFKRDQTSATMQERLGVNAATCILSRQELNKYLLGKAFNILSIQTLTIGQTVMIKWLANTQRSIYIFLNS